MFFAAPLAAHGDAHMLVAYSNGADTVVSDVEFHAGALAMTNSAMGGASTVHVSDMVDLVGVPFSSFVANTGNFHFV